MAMNATTEDKERQAENEALGRELAPSLLREDEPSAVRLLGMFGLVFALVGADLLLWAVFHHSALHWIYRLARKAAPDSPGIVGTLFGTVFFAGGLAAMLLHAALEKEAQLRRTYGLFGVVWLVLGLLGILFQMAHLGWAENLFLPGAAAVALGLFFLLAFVHNELAADWRELTVGGLGIVGGVMALVGFLGGNIFAAFLLPDGFVLMLLGLAFLSAFLLARGSDDDLGYRAGLGVGALGAVIFLVALVRSIAQISSGYFVPNGVVLLILGLLYVLVYVLLFVENPVVVIARRELAAFFYSPIAYLVLLGFTFIGWLALVQFLDRAIPSQMGEQPLFEPIVRAFFFGIVPVIGIVFIVPVLTMRSLSEEKRTGTMEVLLTIPVSEWQVVLSKFAATLAFFMLLWVPWALYLVALRVGGGQPFDIRPVLCFLVVLLITGANFVSMGLFFSSVTRNQIIAAVLTFAGMFALLFIYFAIFMIQQKAADSAWIPLLTHMSFVDLWFDSLDGKLEPTYLLFHVSAAIFWLFLTVKVLEARRWS